MYALVNEEDSWLGLRRNETTGAWAWTDRSPVRPRRPRTRPSTLRPLNHTCMGNISRGCTCSREHRVRSISAPKHQFCAHNRLSEDLVIIIRGSTPESGIERYAYYCELVKNVDFKLSTNNVIICEACVHGVQRSDCWLFAGGQAVWCRCVEVKRR